MKSQNEVAPIWYGKQLPNLHRQSIPDTMAHHLGIEFLEVGPAFLSGRMPVDRRTRQIHGLLHGGASVALAETLMSYAATLCLDGKKQYAVGLEINANHIRSVTKGWVIGTARPLHLGRTTHVWQCEICDEAGNLVSFSRMTHAILDRARRERKRPA